MSKQIRYCFAVIVFFILFINNNSNAQCPQNIGFESGNFDNWQCFAGTISGSGNLSLSATAPLADRHVIFANNGQQQELDFYGGFPVNCPNGSKYSIRLGNSSTGGQAESVTYTFTVPATANDYSIIYNYAVVFQNPNPPHLTYQQPRFMAKVFDAAGNTYLGCGSFEYISSSSLPGFQVSPKKADVFYKTWSPVTIKLAGYAGKTITLEFTTNDCTQGGHFGYAYVDVNENCTSPISGNVFCTGVTDSMSLVAPFGFQEYHWYNANFTTLLGTSNVLTLKPPPPVGTEYALEIVPYPGLGCLDTLRTVIKHSGTPFDLSVQSTVASCGIAPIDLTAPAITAGSSPGLTFSYFTDLTQLNYLATPSYVTNSGTYYIKGVNSEGCNGIKPITTVIYQPINLNVEGSILACSPQTIDITKPVIVAGSEGGLIYSYWQDANTSLPLTNANAINTTGTYYIKATNAVGCDIVKPIYATIGNTPDFSVVNQTGCDNVDITGNSVTVLNTPNTNFSYWVDAAATMPITLANAIKSSGTYYIKGEHTSTCSTTKPISVTVNLLPDFTIQQPVPVTYPSTIDFTAFVQSAASNLSFTYWKDAAATIPLNNATAVDSTNTYYVKAVAPTGCSLIKSVKVVVRGVVTSPPNAFSPNGDGVNDTWFIPSLKDYTNCKVEVFNRAGQLVYSSIGYNTPWDGKYNGKLLSVGTYYYIINLGMGKDYPSFNGSISLLY